MPAPRNARDAPSLPRRPGGIGSGQAGLARSASTTLLARLRLSSGLKGSGAAPASGVPDFATVLDRRVAARPSWKPLGFVIWTSVTALRTQERGRVYHHRHPGRTFSAGD